MLLGIINSMGGNEKSGVHRYTVGFPDGMAEKMEKYVNNSKRFNSFADFIRYEVRKDMGKRREEEILKPKGLSIKLDMFDCLDISNEDIEKIMKTMEEYDKMNELNS